MLQMPYRSYMEQNIGGQGPPKTSFDVLLCDWIKENGYKNDTNCIATYDKNDYAVLEGGDGTFQ